LLEEEILPVGSLTEIQHSKVQHTVLVGGVCKAPFQSILSTVSSLINKTNTCKCWLQL